MSGYNRRPLLRHLKFSATLIIAILPGIFMVLGYLLFLWDKRVTVNGKRKFDFSETRAFGFRAFIKTDV